MGAARILSLVFVLFGFCIDVIQAGEFCSQSGYSFYYKYCTYGCCGSSYNKYCCSLDVGIIIGGVVAGILFLSFFIAIICCLVKKKSYTGRVVHPATGTQPPRENVTVIHTGANSSQPYYGAQPMAAGAHPMAAGAQPVPPPAYKQAGAPPPPAYSYSDPAYPPTGSTYPPPPGPAYPPPPAAGPPSPFNMNASQAPSSGTAQVQPPPPGFQVGGATAPPAPPN